MITSNVCSQGQSGRTGDMAWESVVSQKRTFMDAGDNERS